MPNEMLNATQLYMLLFSSKIKSQQEIQRIPCMNATYTVTNTFARQDLLKVKRNDGNVLDFRSTKDLVGKSNQSKSGKDFLSDILELIQTG